MAGLAGHCFASRRWLRRAMRARPQGLNARPALPAPLPAARSWQQGSDRFNSFVDRNKNLARLAAGAPWVPAAARAVPA